MTQPEVAPVTTAPLARSTSVLSWIALGLAGLGFLLAVIPFASFVAWLFTLPAFILAIIGLVQKGRAKVVPAIALALSIVAFIIAIIVSVVTVAASPTGQSGFSAGQQSDDSVDVPEDEPKDEPIVEAAPDYMVGDTVTNDDNVSFAVTAVQCGFPTYGESFLEETASGQFCEIKFAINNGGNDTLDLFAGDVTGLIGAAEYEPETLLGGFGDDGFYSKLNPGLSTEGIAVIDIPADGKLDTIKLQTNWVFGDEILIRVP